MHGRIHVRRLPCPSRSPKVRRRGPWTRHGIRFPLAASFGSIPFPLRVVEQLKPEVRFRHGGRQGGYDSDPYERSPAPIHWSSSEVPLECLRTVEHLRQPGTLNPPPHLLHQGQHQRQRGGSMHAVNGSRKVAPLS